MILPSEEVLILRQFDRQADLVAGGTEFRLLVEWLKKSPFVELWLGFDQLLVDELQNAVRAVGERIMNGLINCVIAIAASAVDVGDRVASRAVLRRDPRGAPPS